MRVRRLLPLVACLALLGGGGAAAGEQRDDARGAQVQALSARAVADYDAGRFEAALSLYREAHGLLPLPALSFMEARCLERLRRLPAAVTALERALLESPDEDLRGRVTQKLADLRLELGQARLVLLVEPAGVEVRLDGVPRGPAPVPPLALDPGTHLVELRLPGYGSESRTVALQGGSETVLSVTLTPLAAAPAGAAPPPPPPPGPWYTNGWGWGALGLGVAAGAAATALLVVAEQHRDDVRALRSEQPVRSMDQETAYARWDLADREATAGWVLTGVAGAALVTSVVLFTTVDPPPGEATVLSAGVAPLSAGAALTVQGSF